jgi:hypothetical protein
MAQYDSMCNNDDSMTVLHFKQQLQEMHIDERVHPYIHALLALNTLKARIIAMSFEVSFCSGFSTRVLMALREFFHFVKSKILFAEKLKFCGFGWSRVLRVTNGFGSLNCAL